MGDTRCKHCGERIVLMGWNATWYHRGPDDAPASGAYKACRPYVLATPATPEEARRE